MRLTLKKVQTQRFCDREKKMGRSIAIGSPFFYLLFVVFQLLQQHCMAVAGDILVAPENQQIAVNTGMAEFFCRTSGHNARWIIGMETYDPMNATHLNGFRFTEVITPIENTGDNIYDLQLFIPSMIVWNQTRVTCVSVQDQPRFSDFVYLTVIGGPATPEVELTILSSSQIQLGWNKPFSWDDYPIQHYEISSNYSEYFTPEVELNNVNKSRENVVIDIIDELEECQAIQFSVRANNGLADSKTASITTGFSMAPDVSTVSIEETVKFVLKNRRLKPLISLQIELPRVCWYQELAYTVTLSRMGDELGEASATLPSQRLYYGEGTSVTAEFVDNLIDGADYTVTVEFNTFAENDETLTTAVHATKTFYISSNGGAATQGGDPETGGVNIPQILTEETIIIIGIVAGVIILFLSLFIVLGLVACANRRTRLSLGRRVQNRPLPLPIGMITNGTYEGCGPVYETVDQLKLSSLQRPTTPTTPSSIAPLLIDSPYTTSNAQPYIEPDSYTIMISSDSTKVNTGTREASSPESGVRYGPEPGSFVTTSSDW